MHDRELQGKGHNSGATLYQATRFDIQLHHKKSHIMSANADVKHPSCADTSIIIGYEDVNAASVALARERPYAHHSIRIYPVFL